MRTSRTVISRVSMGLVLIVGGAGIALADQPSTEAPKSLPQGSFFSSIKQSLGHDPSRDIVRGHFDLGLPPNQRRYYCLIDTKLNTKEPFGVLAEPDPRPDGMTGIKNGYVSQYSCADAEQQGMLVTAGYVVPGAGAAAAGAPPTQASAASSAPVAPAVPAPPATVPATAPTAVPAAAPAAAAPVVAAPAAAVAAAAVDAAATPAASEIEVAGLRLGMSPDEVRAQIKSKNLLNYNESSETLSYLDPSTGGVRSITNGRFVSVIAAWTAPPAAAATAAASDSLQADGESYEVMFSPVPGKERVMGIIHTMGYSLTNAIHEVALEDALIKKYGGFAATDELPQSPTWRIQNGGSVQVGDSCNRRATLGGLGRLDVAEGSRENLALKRPAEDFKSQIDRCGIAILTEDHHTANGGALRDERLVTRYTVTAYSPVIGLEGATTAAQLIRSARGAVKSSDSSRAKGQSAPTL
jgi:hypothetical protein